MKRQQATNLFVNIKEALNPDMVEKLYLVPKVWFLRIPKTVTSFANQSELTASRSELISSHG